MINLCNSLLEMFSADIGNQKWSLNKGNEEPIVDL